MHGSKRLLIISHGPVPTPEHLHVEGGGLRCWGLARGIRSNATDLEITVAYHEIYRKPDHTPEFEGIRIATWDHETIGSLARGFDSVLISYCMGEHAVRLVRGLRPRISSSSWTAMSRSSPRSRRATAPTSSGSRRITSARSDLDGAARARGPLPLRHRAQERYYQGVLSALGRINPMTYGRPMILEVPYGIYRDEPRVTDRPITRLRGRRPGEEDPLVRRASIPGSTPGGWSTRWPWSTGALPARLVIVGRGTPSTSIPTCWRSTRSSPSTSRRPEYRDLVFMQDWVDFQRRADWYLDADLVVTVNKPGRGERPVVADPAG